MPSRIQRPIDLDAALRGESDALDAKDAVYRLARSGRADAKDRLRQMILDGQTMPIRRRAALGLSLVPDARGALHDVVGTIEDPKVLTGVLLSLARVGTGQDLAVIRKAADRLSGHDADEARFAALLLAHRMHLGFDVVPPIPTPVAREAPSKTKPVAIGSAEEAARAWRRFVPNASLGFIPDPGRSVVVHCARRPMLIIPSIDLTPDAGPRLLKERLVAGATAAYERETGTWHHDLWILSTPSPKGIELQAWTQGGRAMYAGVATVDQGTITFELRTTETSRLALAHVRGRVSGEGITISGTVGDRDPSDARTMASRPRPQ
jgi:hypothetical protein